MNKKIFIFFACNMLCASDENRFAFSPSARTEPAGSSGDIPLARNNNNNRLSEVLAILCNTYSEFSKDQEEWSLIKDARAAKTEYEMKVSEEKRRLIEECGQINHFNKPTKIIDNIIGSHLENTSSLYYQKFVIYTNPITRRAKFSSIPTFRKLGIYDFATFDSETSTLDAHYKDNLDPALIQAIKDDPDLTQDSLVRFAKIHDFELYNKMLKAKEKLDIYMQEKEQKKEQEKKEKEQSLKVEKILAIINSVKKLGIGSIEDGPADFTRFKFNLMKSLRNRIKQEFIKHLRFINPNNSTLNFSDDLKNCLQAILDYVNTNIQAIRRFNANSSINDSDYSLSTTEEEEYIDEYLKNLLLNGDSKYLVQLLDNLIFALINSDFDKTLNSLRTRHLEEITLNLNTLNSLRTYLIGYLEDLIVENKKFCNSFPDALKKLIEDF